MLFLPHQQKAFDWSKYRTSIPLWMAMRLGKTRVAIRWFERRAHCRHILVVAPLSTLSSWTSELLLLGVALKDICQLTGTARQRERAFEAKPDAKWFLINWEGLAQRGLGKTATGHKKQAQPTRWAALDWDGVCLDESTRIKSATTNTTKVTLKWLSRARYKCCLSGLPNPEGPENFVTQMTFLFGEFMGCRDFWVWRSKYMRPAGPAYLLRPGVAGHVIREVHERSFVMSMKDAGIGSKLIRQRRDVVLPPKVLKAHRLALQHLEVGHLLTNNILHALTWASQLAGGCFPHDDSLQHRAKVRELVRLAKGELAREPLIVAAQYSAELHAAEQALNDANITTVLVKGGEVAKRAGRLDAFRAGKVRALVCQPKVLQMGIDLSAASTTINLSRHHSYEVNAQFDARTEHPMKQVPRLAIDIVATGTVDEAKIAALSNKETTARTFLRVFLAELRKQT